MLHWWTLMRHLQMSRLMTKPTIWLCTQRRLRSAWASAQSDQSLRCPLEESWVISYPLSTQRRLWLDWADAQADSSLRWAHSHFVGFVMSWLKLFKYRLFYEWYINLVLKKSFILVQNNRNEKDHKKKLKTGMFNALSGNNQSRQYSKRKRWQIMSLEN